MVLLYLPCLMLPVAALALVILLGRWKRTRGLVPALLWCGLIFAILAGLFAFTRATVPIAPHETGQGAWLPVIWSVLVVACLGSSLGVLVAGMVGLLIVFFRARREKASPSRGE